MNILVSPLDWGLGHATRLVPVVRMLMSRGHNVFLAGSGNSLRILMAEFPRLTIVSLPSFNPTLSRKNSQFWPLGRQVPSFLLCMKREYRATQRIVRRCSIDMIISDNRYGVRSPRCRSYIITHQFQPHVAEGCPKGLERVVAKFIGRWLSKFDMVLVPDTAIDGTGLAGDLSVPTSSRLKVKPVGVLSRLSHAEGEKLPAVDWLGIVSGPEPQRSMFEAILRDKFKRNKGRCVIVCGRPNDDFSDKLDGNIQLISHCDARREAGLINSAKHIVCRSGYSTVMDLELMHRKAILVPTPGQAEQEYLAQHLIQRGYTAMSQSEFQRMELKD